MRPVIAIAAFVLVWAPALAEASAGDAPFDLAIAQAEKWGRPQETIVFPIEITSHASSALRIEFDVRASEKFLAPVPRPMNLTPERPAVTLPFVVQTPYENGRVDESGEVVVRAWSPSAAGERVLTLIVHAKGVYVPAPSFAIVALALALALALAPREKT